MFITFSQILVPAFEAMNILIVTEAPATLEEADKGWLARLITRRVALADFAKAFTCREDDVTVVLEMKGR